MNDFETRKARLLPLLEAAQNIADPHAALGRRARERLTLSSGLSAAGVEFALQRCLETKPSEHELAALIASTPRAEVAHVLLSANVFVAAHRAIAIAIAASERVFVRASRREPQMAELLLEGAPHSFQLVPELSPHAGDRLWAYGSDATLEQIAVTLPPGVALHGHGSGFGVAVLDRVEVQSDIDQLLQRLAEDTALFDQRGCLSPRVLLVHGDAARAREVGRALAYALAEISTRLPRGELSRDEAADITRYRELSSFMGEIYPAGPGYVSVGNDSRWLLPPSGRNLHVLPSLDPVRSLSEFAPLITSCAVAGGAELRAALRRKLPGARHPEFGRMQCPPFDGPVDRRDV